MLEVFTRFSSWLKSCMIAKSLSISILNGLEETDITVLEVTPMVTSSNNKRHWRWWRCKKLTKQNAIKKTDEIKTAVMIRGVKAPDRSQVTKLDYALWCRQEQVIRNVSNVTEMSEMSPLVVWKDCTMEVEKRKFAWQKQAVYSSCLEVSGGKKG